MTFWKFVLALLVLLLPGGSLVLLAMATAKALVASRDRWLRLGDRQASEGARPVPVAPTLSAGGGPG